jgi:hypothetical protein
MSLDPVAARLLSADIRAICTRRGTAQGTSGGRRDLDVKLVDELVHKIVDAAQFAALGRVPDCIARRGAPPNNARAILADDIRHALTELGLSDGLHFESAFQSLAVELYTVVAGYVWRYPQGNPLNPRSTFDRMKYAAIDRN